MNMKMRKRVLERVKDETRTQGPASPSSSSSSLTLSFSLVLRVHFFLSNFNGVENVTISIFVLCATCLLFPVGFIFGKADVSRYLSLLQKQASLTN